jgi:hypothetical protein
MLSTPKNHPKQYLCTSNLRRWVAIASGCHSHARQIHIYLTHGRGYCPVRCLHALLPPFNTLANSYVRLSFLFGVALHSQISQASRKRTCCSPNQCIRLAFVHAGGGRAVVWNGQQHAFCCLRCWCCRPTASCAALLACQATCMEHAERPANFRA